MVVGSTQNQRLGRLKILRRGQRDINKLLFIDHDGLVMRRYPIADEGRGGCG